MIFVWDTNVLCLALYPGARYDGPVSDAADRVKFMLERVSANKDLVIIPAPVLAEFLILAANDGPKYLTAIKESSAFRIEAFDERAAIELAEMELKARAAGNKRGSADPSAPWQKIKVDRQIVAIAKVFGVNQIYSTDPDIAAVGADCNIRVSSIDKLMLPAAKAQMKLIETPPPPQEPPESN